MHDIADLEGRGIPSVFIASTEFVDAAAAQSSALGFPALGIFVPHPIQDRTDQEVRDLADAAVDDIVAAITAPSKPGLAGDPTPAAGPASAVR